MEANNSCPLGAFKAKLTDYHSKLTIHMIWLGAILDILGLDVADSGLLEHIKASLRLSASRAPFAGEQTSNQHEKMVMLTCELTTTFKAAVNHVMQTASEADQQIIVTFLGSLR